MIAKPSDTTISAICQNFEANFSYCLSGTYRFFEKISFKTVPIIAQKAVIAQAHAGAQSKAE
jgi:hypothetical protein